MTDIQAESRPRTEVDLDHRSPEFRDGPHRAVRKGREFGCAVAYSDRYEGLRALADYTSVFDAALVSSFPSVVAPTSELPLPIPPIESDPPEAEELREITLMRFSPSSAGRLREAAVEMTNEAIDCFIGRGRD